MGNASDEFVEKKTKEILGRINKLKELARMAANAGKYEEAARISQDIANLEANLQRIKEDAIHPQLVDEVYKSEVRVGNDAGFLLITVYPFFIAVLAFLITIFYPPISLRKFIFIVSILLLLFFIFVRMIARRSIRRHLA